MSIGLGQILLILLLSLLFFGNVPKLLKDIALGLKKAKKVLEKEDEDCSKEKQKLSIEEKDEKNKK